MPLHSIILMVALFAVGLAVSGEYHGPADFVLDFVKNALIVVIVLGVLAVYMIPWRVAKRRKHTKADAILVLNLLLGWTLIGWALALTWAMTEQNQQAS